MLVVLLFQMAKLVETSTSATVPFAIWPLDTAPSASWVVPTAPAAICAAPTAPAAILVLVIEPATRLDPARGPLYEPAVTEPLTATPLPLLVTRSAPVTLTSFPALFERKA